MSGFYEIIILMRTSPLWRAVTSHQHPRPTCELTKIQTTSCVWRLGSGGSLWLCGGILIDREPSIAVRGGGWGQGGRTGIFAKLSQVIAKCWLLVWELNQGQFDPIAWKKEVTCRARDWHQRSKKLIESYKHYSLTNIIKQPLHR